jgi:hypothetical protein
LVFFDAKIVYLGEEEGAKREREREREVIGVCRSYGNGLFTARLRGAAANGAACRPNGTEQTTTCCSSKSSSPSQSE